MYRDYVKIWFQLPFKMANNLVIPNEYMNDLVGGCLDMELGIIDLHMPLAKPRYPKHPPQIGIPPCLVGYPFPGLPECDALVPHRRVASVKMSRFH